MGANYTTPLCIPNAAVPCPVYGAVLQEKCGQAGERPEGSNANDKNFRKHDIGEAVERIWFIESRKAKIEAAMMTAFKYV